MSRPGACLARLGVWLAVFLVPELIQAADCNGNRIPDTEEIASGASRDCNRNGIPDECERPPFHRGDLVADGRINVTDPISLFSHLFQGGEAPSCREAADANNDARVDVTDGIALIQHLFLAGEPPAAPGPPVAPCGPDPDPPGSLGDLGCESYPGC